MPNLRNGSKGGFEPGLTRLRVRHSTTELPRSTHNMHYVAYTTFQSKYVYILLGTCYDVGLIETFSSRDVDVNVNANVGMM